MDNDNQNNKDKVEQSQTVLDYEDRWKRALADFENYKKDEAKRLSAFAAFDKITVMRDLLPMFDMFDRAMREVPEGLESSPWVEGIRRIFDEFIRIFSKNKINKIETIGKVFDPKYHESVGRTHESGEDVVEEIRMGFVTDDDFVVRPAQVKIGKFN